MSPVPRPAPPRWIGPPAVLAIALAGAVTIPFAALVDGLNVPPPRGLEAFAYDALLFGCTTLTMLLLLKVVLVPPRASVVWRCLFTGVAMGLVESWLFAAMWLSYHPPIGKFLSIPGVLIAAGIVGIITGCAFGIVLAPFAYVARDTTRVDTFDRTLHVLAIALLTVALPVAIFQSFGGVDRGYEGLLFSVLALIALLVVLVRELGRRAWLGKLQPPWSLVPRRAEDRLPILVAPGDQALAFVTLSTEAAGGPFRGAETVMRVAHLDPEKARAVASRRAAVAGALAGITALSLPGQLYQRSQSIEHRRREWAPAHPTTVSGIGLLATTNLYVGDDYGCAQLRDGTLRCWGNDGGIISGTAEDTNWTANEVFPLGPVRAVGTPNGHLCVARENTARAQCFGRFLGRTSREWAGPAGYVGSFANAGPMVYAVSAGEVWRWSVEPQNLYEPNANVLPAAPPQRIDGLKDIVSVSAALRHQCAIDETGALFCWGQNNGGSVDPRINAEGAVLEPVRVAGMEQVNRVVAAEMATFARANGRWFSWGDRQARRWIFDQSFEYDAIPMPGPEAIADTDHVTDLVVTDRYACALSDDGSVKCFTPPSYDESPTSKQVMDGLPPGTALSIAGSRKQLCARTTSMLANVRCWGPRDP